MEKTVQICLQNKNFYNNLSAKNVLKGQSNEIFDLQFFSYFEPVWATDQWGKIVLSMIKISLSYSTFRLKKLTPRGIIPQGVKKNFTPRTFFKNEKFSPLILEYESIIVSVTQSL